MVGGSLSTADDQVSCPGPRCCRSQRPAVRRRPAGSRCGERAAFALPEDDVPHACALACVGESRMRLDLAPDRGLAAELKHAQRLACSVNPLCDHH
ncbi:DUF6415 family natural product biosynthesis protein [Streptomyces sp. NPDC060205]|uniref:DUF6415 family natural product biosynthesis protein n=1 Tax=Streptomyces sp. NPDC060205 TaxID=3347072 RepID=UPI00365521DC